MRTILNDTLWVTRTGAPWRDLPERYGSWKTVPSRFYCWREAGVWDRILAELQRQAEAEGKIEWAVHYVDSTIVRAHRHSGC